MRKCSLALALILIIGLLVPLTSCKVGDNSKYSVVERLETQQLCVAFRQEDKAGDAVIAALAELEAEGEVNSLTRKWFGSDLSLLKGDEQAISKLDFEIEQRTFIMGYDAWHLPFSGEVDGAAAGFDVDLAKAVCSKLGWRIKFVAVDVSNAYVELNSGNVDCVWGGLPYDESSTKIRQSPVYFKNTVIIAALAGTGRSLSGKTLAIPEMGCFIAILDAHPDMKKKPEFIVKLPGGVDACFEALDKGVCDAIITDLAGIDYYR